MTKLCNLDRFDHEDGDEYGGSKFGGFTDYFRRKKIKLQNLDAELRANSDSPQVFRGVVVHINGYTQPSLNDLHKMIVAHGGGFMQYLDGKTTVTHIVASNLTPRKAEEFRKYRIVKPAWIVDSIEAGVLLPWHSYKVIDEGPAQKVLAFGPEGITSQANLRSKSYREVSDVSWYNQQLSQAPNSKTSSHNFLKPAIPARKTEIAHKFPDDDDIDDPDEPQSASGVNNDTFEVNKSKVRDENEQDEESEEDDTTNQDMKEEAEARGEPQIVSQGSYDDLYDNSFEVSTEEIRKITDVDPSRTVTDTAPKVLNDDVSKVLTQEEEIIPISAQVRQASPELYVPDREKRPPEVEAEMPSKKRKLTAEEHNAILLADPHLRRSTVVHPDFLQQYYKESRLHHLSAWKSDLKSEMQALADEMSTSQKAKQKRPANSRRYILHVDFDCFFAAVSLRKHPEYQDKPTVVAHGGGAGAEIASCNYVARKYGIKNGMWMKKAQELCNDIKVLSYDFPAYEETSRHFYEAIIATGGLVQSVSVDEALVDVSMLCFSAVGSDGISRAESTVYREQEHAWSIGQNLRNEIKQRTGCAVSVGIGGNILLAKLALRKAKPAGQYYVRPEEAMDFIGPLEVQDLPGVAWNMGGKLEEIGIKLIKDIREVSKEKLVSTMGPKTGEKLWEYARGIDRKEVGDIEIRKSVSTEVNWGVRFENQEQVDEFIASLCTELNKRLVKEGVRGKQLTLKIMKRRADAPLDPPKNLGHGLCDSFSKATQLGVATNAPEIMTREILAMLKSFGFSPGELRGIGVQMTKLESLKSGPGRADGSQPMIQFKPKVERKSAPVRFAEIDPIQDPITPKKPKEIPITDTGTPSRVVFGADHLNQLTPSRKPLNIKGTQFVLPTQFDPKVLGELPSDIRSKLLGANANGKKNSNLAPRPGDGFPAVLTALPAESQIDPEVFNALPPEMQSEVLSFYKETPGIADSIEPIPSKLHNPSPRASPSPHKPPPPQAVRKRGRPPKNQAYNPPLNRANFITTHFRKQTPDTSSDTDILPKPKVTKKPDPKLPSLLSPQKKLTIHPDLEGIDPAFLSALPEEMRKEVILQNRLSRLRKRNEEVARQRKLEEKNRPKRPKEYLHLPARTPRPTFTTAKLSRLSKLRESISEWVDEFRDIGPYNEDTAALGTYIARVVREEGDMGKAGKCVAWLKWVVEEELGEDDAKREWCDAVKEVQVIVQGAVNERGLGKLNI